MDKSIIKSVHDSVRDLHGIGAVDQVTMRKFDALCLKPVRPFSPIQIKKIRLRSKVSQAVFALFLNTSKSTVQQWEQGVKKPNGPSLKLLNLIEHKGLMVLC